MAMWPAAMLVIICGIMNGEKRVGPFSINTRIWSIRMCNPPMPDPKSTPARSGTTEPSASPASFTASLAEATPYWVNGSMRRCSLGVR